MLMSRTNNLVHIGSVLEISMEDWASYFCVTPSEHFFFTEKSFGHPVWVVYTRRSMKPEMAHFVNNSVKYICWNRKIVHCVIIRTEHSKYFLLNFYTFRKLYHVKKKSQLLPIIYCRFSVTVGLSKIQQHNILIFFMGLLIKLYLENLTSPC